MVVYYSFYAAAVKILEEKCDAFSSVLGIDSQRRLNSGSRKVFDKEAAKNKYNLYFFVCKAAY